MDIASVAEGYGAWEDEFAEVAWHNDATNTWQAVDDADPTGVLTPYPQAPYVHPQGAYGPGPGVAPGPAQQPYPQAGFVIPPVSAVPQWNPSPTAGVVGVHDETASSPKKKNAWISGAAVLALLASLPFVLGMNGTLIVGIALTIFGLVGAMSRWIERRRILRGPRPSDGATVIAISPILLARSIVTTALGLVVGGFIPYLVWAGVSYSYEGRVLWTWPADIATSSDLDHSDYWLSDPRGTITVWALAAATIWVTWLMPFAVDLCVGTATSLRAIVRPAWGRAFLTVGCGGFLAGAQLIVTGRLSH